MCGGGGGGGGGGGEYVRMNVYVCIYVQRECTSQRRLPKTQFD